jgi:hypothetical protein
LWSPPGELIVRVLSELIGTLLPRTINGLAAELIVRVLSGLIDPGLTPDDQRPSTPTAQRSLPRE